MACEWDAEKAKANFLKQHIRFAGAVIALEDERALTIRDAYSDDEDGFAARKAAI
jgi:uncharacterized DUF497 family protein